MSHTRKTESRRKFYKYHGCGNDFIIIDQIRTPSESETRAWLNEQTIKDLCTWHTGIGADGLMVLWPSDRHSFRMDYFNADGRAGSLCGNGSRCAVRCAHDLGILPEKDGLFHFEAYDGIHTARLEGSQISITLNDFPIPEKALHGCFVDNGSPHFLIHKDNINGLDVEQEGKQWRSHARFAPGGTNVNYVEVVQQNQLRIRTFERGVERETMACGTGVVAAAAWYASHHKKPKKSNENHQIEVETLGGKLQVQFTTSGEHIQSVRLTGPAVLVFEGQLPDRTPESNTQ